MKKPTLIKHLLLTLLVIAGTNIFSSCDSCTRKTTETTTTTGTESMDTTSTGDDTGFINDDSSGNTSRVNDGTASISTSSASRSKTATGTSTAAAGTKKSGLSEEEITNRIENSDARSGAVDKNGNPVKSSGDAGTGMGTGTGSTGNNSRVTTREAQKGN